MSSTLRITACPSCGSDKIKTVRRDWSNEFERRPHTVSSLEFYECPGYRFERLPPTTDAAGNQEA